MYPADLSEDCGLVVIDSGVDYEHEDLVFDPTRAHQDFGYDPRPFRFPDEPR